MLYLRLVLSMIQTESKCNALEGTGYSYVESGS
jgi:hypothetical protein